VRTNGDAPFGKDLTGFLNGNVEHCLVIVGHKLTWYPGLRGLIEFRTAISGVPQARKNITVLVQLLVDGRQSTRALSGWWP